MAVKVGLIARGEDRGLGIQTWEFARGMEPDRTLLVDMGELARGFPTHADRYPDATVALFDPHRGLPEDVVRPWLDGLDVVFSAETIYDQRIIAWCREQGIATVVQLNPEFYKHPSDPNLLHPTMWWAPSPWRMEHLAANTRLVPVPVALDRFHVEPRVHEGGPLRVLHVVGHRAAGDRNGTTEMLVATSHLREPVHVTFVTQDRRLPSPRATRRGVTSRVVLGGVGNYWDLYDGHDVLVMPRRYGGLCLPVQEAMAAGLAVVMTDCEPQRSYWPVVLAPSRTQGVLRTATGDVPLTVAHPGGLAATIDRLARNRDELAEWQARGRSWAVEHSWAAMRSEYDLELEWAVRAART